MLCGEQVSHLGDSEPDCPASTSEFGFDVIYRLLGI